jgi:hypothetical protein
MDRACGLLGERADRPSVSGAWGRVSLAAACASACPCRPGMHRRRRSGLAHERAGSARKRSPTTRLRYDKKPSNRVTRTAELDRRGRQARPEIACDDGAGATERARPAGVGAARRATRRFGARRRPIRQRGDGSGLDAARAVVAPRPSREAIPPKMSNRADAAKARRGLRRSRRWESPRSLR